MRLKKIKNAYDRLHADLKYFVGNPKVNKGNWHKIFNNDNPLHIEIGCGKGRFIIQTAMKYPDINFVAIEKFDSVLIKALENANEYDIPNLKLVLFDAIKLEEIFSKEEINTIYLNFSDPWPKKKHERRRLTNALFLNVFTNVLDNYGSIIQKTDNRLLFESSLESFSKDNWYISDISLDLHKTTRFNIQTEYEEKWSKKGPIYTLRAYKNSLLNDTFKVNFEKIDSNINFDVSEKVIKSEEVNNFLLDVTTFDNTKKEVSLNNLLKYNFYNLTKVENEKEKYFYTISSLNDSVKLDSNIYAVFRCKFVKLDDILAYINSNNFKHQRYQISKETILIKYETIEDVFMCKIYLKAVIN